MIMKMRSMVGSCCHYNDLRLHRSFLRAVLLLLLLQLPTVVVNVVQGKSVWNQLQDHAQYAHDHNPHSANTNTLQRQDDEIPSMMVVVPSQPHPPVNAPSKGGDQIYNFPHLFKDVGGTKDNHSPTVPSSLSSSSTLMTSKTGVSSPSSSSNDDDDAVDALPTTTRKGMMSMMKNSNNNNMMSSIIITTKTPTVLSTVTFAPSPTVDNGDGKGMSGMSMKETNITPSPSQSSEPTYIDSPYPTNVDDTKGGKGSGMMSKTDKGTKTTPSPSISVEPTYIDSPYPTKVDENKGGKGSGMMSKTDKDTKTTPSPSISVEPTYIDSPYPTKVNDKHIMGGGGKGKGSSGSDIWNMGKDPKMMMIIGTTNHPSISVVPSTTIVPTITSTVGGMMMGGMGMMAMGKGGGMDGMGGMGKGGMSKMTIPPTNIPITLETILPTSMSLPMAPTNNRVQLSPYTLRYTFNQTRIPTTLDIDDVVAVTRMYLEEYFEIRYPDIIEFMTNLTGTQFSLQAPFVINYTSVAVFDPMPSITTDDDNSVDNSIIVPPMEELDIILIAAFTGVNLISYTNKLKDLPPVNIFRTTTNVTFNINLMADNNTATNGTVRSDDDSGSNGNGRKHSAKARAGIATGTGVLVIALISIFAIVRNKKKQNGILLRVENHDIHPIKRHPNNMSNNDNDDEGHMTVAGDTYMAESTVVSGGTASILTTNQNRKGRRFNRRILSQSRELAVMRPPSTDAQYSTLLPPLGAEPSSPSDVSMRRGVYDMGSDDDDNNQNMDDNVDLTHDVNENGDDDNRSLLPFYTTSPEPAYRGALSVDVNERRDVLLAMRDDMRLPRHFTDDIPNHMILHNDIDNMNDDDDDTLSVDDDVPLRVIDLIRKFTTTKRHR